MTLLEYQKIKISLQKTLFQIGLKMFLFLQKLEILPLEQLLVILQAKKFLEHLRTKNCKKNKSKRVSVEKVIKRKGDKLYAKWSGYDNFFNSWIDKKDINK